MRSFLLLLPVLSQLALASLDSSLHWGDTSVLSIRRRHHQNRPRAAAVLPANWAALGCYSDATSNRALGMRSKIRWWHSHRADRDAFSCGLHCHFFQHPSCVYCDLRIKRVRVCWRRIWCGSPRFSSVGDALKPFTITGTECYCGSSITVSSSPTTGQSYPSSDCSMPCAGDGSQLCGNGGRVYIYKYTAPAASTALPTGWSVKGCYIDDSNNRALGGPKTSLSTNTPASCLTSCSSAGYSLAGVEYGTVPPLGHPLRV